MTEIERLIESIDALAEKATPAPWKHEASDGDCQCSGVRHDSPDDCEAWEYYAPANIPQMFTVDMHEYHGIRDAAFVAALRNAWPELRVALLAQRASINALEQLRPVWAYGHTQEGVNRQVEAAALSQIWAALGASNQTDAMLTLRALLAEKKRSDEAEAQNVMLRKIAAYVPAMDYIKAKEAAGYGVQIKAALQEPPHE
jgi:hypothetical protein